MAIAQSDVGIELWASATGASASFEKLIDIISIPATGSAQGKLEVTVLSASKKQYIADREDTPDMEFGYNYTEDNFDTVDAVCNQDYYFLIIYGDGTGELIFGEGNTWKEAVSRGQALEAKLNVVAQSSEHQSSTEVTALKSGS
jgi:hypothetical protein